MIVVPGISVRQILVTVACGLILGVGVPTNAHAQITYGYAVPVYGGVESTATTYSPFGAQTTTTYYSPFTGTISQTYGSYATPFGARSFLNYYSPFTGFVGQAYSANVFGAANSVIYGYNPWNGYRYGTGLYQPNAYVAPLTGYNYGWLRRR